jgi:dihydroorotate dehydrogenase
MVLGIAALGFGFTEIGTVTPRPQPGNPRPRLVRLPHSRALLNRFGFNSEGADQVAARLRALRSRYAVQIPIGVNIGKNKTTSMNDAAKDYATAMEKLYAVSDYLVINVSSPNTPGLISLQEGENLPALLATVRDCRDRLASTVAGPKRPLFLKLSPDLLDKGLRDAVDCAMNAGFLGIIATNTSRRRNLEGISELDRPLLAQDGGLSGAPLRGEAYERIRKIRAWMGKSGCLISVGGLGDVADARARLELGADLLQVYSEFVYAGPAYPFQMGNAL